MKTHYLDSSVDFDKWMFFATNKTSPDELKRLISSDSISDIVRRILIVAAESRGIAL